MLPKCKSLRQELFWSIVYTPRFCAMNVMSEGFFFLMHMKKVVCRMESRGQSYRTWQRSVHVFGLFVRVFLTPGCLFSQPNEGTAVTSSYRRRGSIWTTMSAEPHHSVPWETWTSLIWLGLESQWDFLSVCSLSFSCTHVVSICPLDINISLPLSFCFVFEEHLLEVTHFCVRMKLVVITEDASHTTCRHKVHSLGCGR